MRTRRKLTLVITALVAVMVGGVAFAAWTSSGSGTQTATAGTASSVVVAGDPVSGLYPTGSFPATVEVTNPNAYGVKVTALNFTGATTTTSGCNASSVTVPDLTGLAQVITAGGDHTFDVTVSMSNDAVDACQGASFTLAYTAVAASN